MDYQKAIESLRLEGGIEITGNPRRVAKFFDGLDAAICAMRELQELKVSDDNLNDHIQELKQAKYDIETFWEEPTALSRAMQRAINALIEVKLYKQFGTPEEVWEALEKQTAKKPAEQSCTERTYYKCPDCGFIMLIVYANGNRLGNQPKFCEKCGKHIDWGEEE